MMSMAQLGAVAASRRRASSLANVSSLLHFDGANASTAFTDVIGKVWTRVGTPTISTAQSKFGGASGLFNGSGQAITTPDALDLNFGAGDFTIEGFVRLSTFAVAGGPTNLVLKDNPAPVTLGMSPVRIDINPDGSVSMYSSYTGAAQDIAQTSAAGQVVLNTWYHIALVRNGTTLKLYLGGVQKLTANIAANALWTNAFPFRYGGRLHNGAALALNGHMDEWRVSKGVAKYTAAFAPPTAAF